MEGQTLIYASVLLTSILGIILGAVALSYKELIKKYYLLRDEHEKIVANEKARQEELIKKAKEESDLIIQNARQKAQETINEAGLYSEKSKQIFELEVKKASDTLISNFQAVLESAKTQTASAYGDISKEVRIEIVKQIETLRLAMQQEIVRSQTEAKRVIDEQYKKIEEETKAYKAEKLKRVDEEILTLLKEVSNKAIGKVLNFEDHEDILLEALDNAKRQNLL